MQSIWQSSYHSANVVSCCFYHVPTVHWACPLGKQVLCSAQAVITPCKHALAVVLGLLSLKVKVENKTVWPSLLTAEMRHTFLPGECCRGPLSLHLAPGWYPNRKFCSQSPSRGPPAQQRYCFSNSLASPGLVPSQSFLHPPFPL